MKRHITLALLRVLLAFGIVYAMPFAHLQWGESYPGDGQEAFGFIIIFIVIGLAAAAVFVVAGSLGQFLLRKRPVRYTVLTDLTIFGVFAALLIYAGVTARYSDSQPNQGAAVNRRPAGQLDGSDNLSAIVAADPAFPGAIAELSHYAVCRTGVGSS